MPKPRARRAVTAFQTAARLSPRAAAASSPETVSPLRASNMRSTSSVTAMA